MRTLTWNRWVLANAIGGLVGLVLGVVLGALTLGSGCGMGLAIGIYQWRALRHAATEQVAKANKYMFIWIGACVLGALLPGWLMFFAAIMGGSNGGVPVRDAGAYIGGVTGAVALFAGVAGLIFGVGVGAIQLIVLRAIWPHASRSARFAWVGATAVGWGGSWALEGTGAGLVITSGAAHGALTIVQLVGGLLLLIGCWAFNGAVTGAALAQMNIGPADSSPSATGVVTL